MDWIFGWVQDLMYLVFNLVNTVVGTLFGFLGLDWDELEPPQLF